MNTKDYSKIIIFLLFAGLLSSCNNADLESRVAALERKVADMEENKGPAINPISTVQSQTPSTSEEAAPQGPFPKFEFEEESFDFGDIVEGDVVKHVFKFKNVGEAPLIIQNATAPCGCTVPSWPKEPIPVGESGEIEVQFNSKNKAGVQNKPVTITANTTPTTSKVIIKANVNKAEDN